MKKMKFGTNTMNYEQRDLILIYFPFTDLKRNKLRPAIVLSNNKYNQENQDVIAVPLTSNLTNNEYSLSIEQKNLEKGKLIIKSNVKTDKIFSVEKRIVKMSIGKVKEKIKAKILNNISKIIN